MTIFRCNYCFIVFQWWCRRIATTDFTQFISYPIYPLVSIKWNVKWNITNFNLSKCCFRKYCRRRGKFLFDYCLGKQIALSKLEEFNDNSICFVGLYFFMNMLLAVIYNQFRGSFMVSLWLYWLYSSICIVTHLFGYFQLIVI